MRCEYSTAEKTVPFFIATNWTTPLKLFEHVPADIRYRRYGRKSKNKGKVAVMFANVWKRDSRMYYLHMCVRLQYVMQAQVKVFVDMEQ